MLVVVRIANNELDRNLLLKELAAFATALSFAWLLVSMRGVRLQSLQRLGAFNKRMADFSYSLYLIHMPLMFFLLAALHATGAFPGIARGYSPVDPIGLGVYALVIVIVVVSAWLFSLATEMQTHHVRTWLKRRITASRPVVPPEAATAIDQRPGMPR